MTVENGLDTPDTAVLDQMIEDGKLDPRVTAYLSIVRSQSIGWMMHDKVICNLLRVSQFIVRGIKRAVAKLPGVRRVRYVNHRGLEYDGLLIGDHAEGEGYDIVGWYDGGRYVKGLPPMIVEALDFSGLHSTSTSSPRRTAKSSSPSTGLTPDGASDPEGVRAERVTQSNAEKRLALAEYKEQHPDESPGCAVVEAILDYRNEHRRPDYWQGNIGSYVGEFSEREAYAAVERVARAGKPFTPEWIARGIDAVRRTS